MAQPTFVPGARLAAALVAVVLAALPSVGRASPPRQDIEDLVLAGEADRLQLMGQVRVYTISLFLPADVLGRERLASPEVRKALRIVLHYEPDLNARVPIHWQGELVPELQPADTQHLRGAVAPMRAGDVLTIAYTPGKGTSVRVNERTAVSTGHHDLMLAFLDRWLGQRPVSEEVKRTLLQRLQ